jgi:hypothetical protein
VIKTLLFTAMLLLPALAYGGNPSANLSVQVVPAGSSGGLPGSILPQGTWVNDLDEHFSGTSLNTNIWQALVGGQGQAGGVSYCDTPGAMVVNNGLTIYALPSVGGQNTGCVVQNNFTFGTPGYFETYMKADTGYNLSHLWQGIFFIVGQMDSCQGDFAANGGEVDLVEALFAGSGNAVQGVVQNGYLSCDTYNRFNNYPAADAYHVWGMDYGDNASITLYRDGELIATWAPADGVEPPSCSGLAHCANGGWEAQIILMDYAVAGTFGGSNGAHFAWVRHYHH